MTVSDSWVTRIITKRLREAARRLDEEITEEVRRQGTPRAPVVVRDNSGLNSYGG